jgi:hypothetical protein
MSGNERWINAVVSMRIMLEILPLVLIAVDLKRIQTEERILDKL